MSVAQEPGGFSALSHCSLAWNTIVKQGLGLGGGIQLQQRWVGELRIGQ